MSVIPVILSSFILSTLSADFVAQKMSCYDTGTPGTSKWDANLMWECESYHGMAGYFNGMESYHDNYHEDRRTTIRFCETNSGATYHDEQILPFTQYDASWKRGCGGGSAIYRAFSIHNNDREDRQFEFRCSVPSDDFILGSCDYIGYYPANFDGGIHEDCPNNGVMRTIESYHDNSHEDRKFRFECCIVYQNPYNYTSMIFSANDFYSNEWDGPHDVIKQGYFLSGMESYHSNSREDRRFKWQFCKPSSGSYISEAVMDETSYDSPFFRSCSVYNGGNAAMIRAKSYHDNDYEDRRWTFTCGLLDNEEYDLVNCGWTGNLNEYDGELDFHCPNNGVIVGIYSQHNNDYEDRIWRMNCCNIAERDYEFTNIEGYWIEILSSEILIKTGIERSNGEEVTDEYSQSLSVAVSAGYEFVFGGMIGIEITGEIASSTVTTISESFTTYNEYTLSNYCASGVQYLYQFIIESDQATVNTHKYRCTNIENPACVPGFFNCVVDDPNCNECKSNFPSE